MGCGMNEGRKDVKKSKIKIDRATQIAIMKFFLKTSIPKILKDREQKAP